jgi:predicted amidohydrolase YtcJ
MHPTMAKTITLICWVLMLAACDTREPAVSLAEFEAESKAGLVFINGGIYTLDPEQPWAEAAAVADGEIVFAGNNEGAYSYVGGETRLIDLEGKMLLPGFHDSHVHLVAGGQTENSCNLAELYTLQELLDQLETCKDLPGRGAEGWITGGVWDREPFNGSPPDKALLDRYFPNRPAFLWSSDGHSAWVNSRALQLAGIDRDTPDPPGGLIDRYPDHGEPLGILSESAMDLVEDIIPGKTADEAIADVNAAVEKAHSYGITSIIEPGLDADMLNPLAVMDKSGALKLRVLASMSPLNWTPAALDDAVFDMIEARNIWNGPNLSTDSVKFYVDGVLETGTALLIDPYLDPEYDNSDPPFYAQDELNGYFRRLDAAGLQIHVHAIGDGAVRSALDAFEAARAANGPSANRHHIVHLQLVHPEDYARFGELGVSANFQALWAWPDYWITELNLPEIGRERVDRMYPIGSIQRNGGRIVGGSDWSVSSLDPLQAIEVAMRRQNPDSDDGEVLNASERVDLATMIAAYTVNGAYLMKHEDRVGSIQTGKRADLVVLDRNLFEIAATEINAARVLMTVFDGEVVYAAAESGVPR